uniref:HDC00395 n=1 Tax=Drosophila melanogaster TaxID=7227 RepID=Q6IHX8_DROME|nr:TPA_inf: HDC00395 [Drosophila melanogaster]
MDPASSIQHQHPPSNIDTDESGGPATSNVVARGCIQVWGSESESETRTKSRASIIWPPRWSPQMQHATTTAA